MSKTEDLKWSLEVDVQHVEYKRSIVVFEGGCSACQRQKIYSGL